VTASLRDCILAAADAVDAGRDELGRLDAVAGDGDHGLTMAHGARAVRRALEENREAPPADLLAKVAMAMASIGGAIGPIYATGLLKTAVAIRASESWDGGVTVARLLACADAAVAAVTTLGHAKPGDKTILDAMTPLAENLRASEAAGVSVDEALVRARDAATAGAAATSGMIASIGRAARLGEQSRGTPDAGATSFAMIVAAAVDTYLGVGRDHESEAAR
jgi:dihydroxyacetone kinase